MVHSKMLYPVLLESGTNPYRNKHTGHYPDSGIQFYRLSGNSRMSKTSATFLYRMAQKQGMLTMEQEGVLKVLIGQTTVEEVARATEEK